MKGIWVMAAVLVVAGAGGAYRPQARGILEQVVAKSFERGTRSLRVESDTQLFAEGRGGAFSLETVSIQNPGLWRRDADGAVDVRQPDGKLVTRVAGQPDQKGKMPTNFLLDAMTSGSPLLADQAVDRLMADLKAMGVDTEIVSLGRADGRVAYFIGSKSWQTDVPMVAIDKESSVVLRTVQGKAPALVETRCLGWGSSVGGNWYPAIVEVVRAGVLETRSVTKTVERNVPLELDFFN
jgi:hypothetical protein